MFDLKNIKDPSFLKKLNNEELVTLCQEIRTFLVESVSKTGGHLASNLGVVELTVALHYVFNSPEDLFLFDVGHQAYVHKILTGRAKDFETLRQLDGLSGYISKKESKHDIWESGHSSSSLSAQTGLVMAKADLKETGRVISIIGDTSISNGLAFEALNFLGQYHNLPPIVILNDNKMGIDKSVGSLRDYLNEIRGSKRRRNFHGFLLKTFPNKVTNLFHKVRRKLKHKNIFEDLGFNYFGPYEGNDVLSLIKVLKKVKDFKEPIILHLITRKGEGYLPATTHMTEFHGVGKFDPKTGVELKDKELLSFGEICAQEVLELRKDSLIKVISPAMVQSCGFNGFKEAYKDDIYDVGIAEDHATVMACGFALKGIKTLVPVYSTFAQRAFDALLNDVSRQNLNVKFFFDRAGVVGEDGETHQGIYDIAMLSLMPNMKICMGKDAAEARGLVDYLFTLDGPAVLRYPRIKVKDMAKKEIKDMRWEVLRKTGKLIIISYGDSLNLIESLNLDAILINARFIRPIDKELLKELPKYNLNILVYEEVIKTSSLYQKILTFYQEKGINQKVYGMHFKENEIVKHGKREKVLEKYHLGGNDLIERYEELKCD